MCVFGGGGGVVCCCCCLLACLFSLLLTDTVLSSYCSLFAMCNPNSNPILGLPITFFFSYMINRSRQSRLW